LSIAIAGYPFSFGKIFKFLHTEICARKTNDR
jgi:hypothetical protein